jgi:hypothetical protein
MVDFFHTDLGNRSRGDVVEITLAGRAANVRLLDSANFHRYRRGQRHEYVGGLARRSLTRLAVPRGGHWHCVVDMQGLRGGQLRAGIRVIPSTALKPLPPIQEQRQQLAAIAANAADIDPSATSDEREFDAFISHATEDKEGIVRPLAQALHAQGLRVWYDEFELQVGDSLRRKIDHGIARSRFGIVVLSRSFFEKSWSQYELDGLVSMSMSGNQVILPLWHEISKDDVIRQSPTLADKVALRTSDYSVAEIAQEIAAVVVQTRDDHPESSLA